MKSPRFAPYLSYLGASAVGQIAGLLLLPVITRRMPPAQFGTYALILAWGGLITSLGPSALRNVGFRLYFHWREDGSPRTLLLVIAGLQVIAFVVPFAILGMVNPTSELTFELVAVAAVAFTMSDFYALQLFVLRAESRARQFAVCEVASGVVRVVVTLWLLESGHVSVTALLCAWIAGSAVGAAFGSPFVYRAVKRGEGERNRSADLRRDLLLPAARAVPLGIGSWTNDVADRVLLAHFEGAGSVGVYSANYALSSRIVIAMAQPVYTMVWPRILKASVEGDQAQVEAEIASGLRAFLWLAALPTAVLCIHPFWVTSVLLGSEYQGADSVVALVAVGAFFQGSVAYVTRGIELAGRYGLMSVATLVASAINIVGNLIMIPIYGIAGAAAATTATYVGLVVFYLFLDPPRYVYRDPRPFLPPLLAAVASTVLGVAVAGDEVWLAAMVVLATYGGAAGATLWRMRRSPEGAG